MDKIIGFLQWAWGFLSPLLGLLRGRTAAGITVDNSPSQTPERKPAAPAPVPQPFVPPPWFGLLGGVDDSPGTVPEGYDGTQPLADKGWAGLVLFAQEMFLTLQLRCRQDGIEIFMTEGYRPRRRQAYLYSLGRMIPNPDSANADKPLGRTVTNAKPGESNHQSGQAFDIALNGPAPYDASGLVRVGRIGKKLKLEWGGDWKGIKDMPHFQVSA